MGAEFAGGGLAVKMPVRLTGQRRVRRERQLGRIRDDDFRRTDALQCCCQFLLAAFAHAEFAAGQIQPGQPCRLFAGEKRQQQGITLVVEQRRIGQRTWRDNA